MQPKSTGQFLLLFPVLICLYCSRLIGPEPPLFVCHESAPVDPKPNAARFGFFSEKFYQGYAVHCDSLVLLFGATPGYTLWFQQIDDPFPATVVAENAHRSIGTVVSLNIKSLSFDQARNDTLLKEISLGRWDSTLLAFAAGAVQCGVTVFLRFGYEMNDNWFPWGNKPAAFVSAWNRAYLVFKNAGADNVRWIFSPNVLWEDRTFAGSILPYYPGDSVVDIIGLDGYNSGDNFDEWHRWQSFKEIFGLSLLGVKTLGKPLWITEIGCVADPRRPGWIEDVLSFMDDNPCVDAMLWFNVQKTGKPDYRLEADSASLLSIRNWLAR
jgi:mannan endo-1,4-beta-mannosidase